LIDEIEGKGKRREAVREDGENDEIKSPSNLLGSKRQEIESVRRS